jgi:hypothetical protein
MAASGRTLGGKWPELAKVERDTRSVVVGSASGLTFTAADTKTEEGIKKLETDIAKYNAQPGRGAKPMWLIDRVEAHGNQRALAWTLTVPQDAMADFLAGAKKQP